MQIDFHHTATYAIARIAGFTHDDAAVIAHCAQYVDDATNGGTIAFDNGAMYTHIASAHKHFDYRNFSDLAMQRVWLPFHFLPGNGGVAAGANPEGRFIEKIICRPNSHVAQDVLRSCIREQDARYGLHRLGITMHVYADTWAHQGFAGVNHRVNDIRALDDHDDHDGTLLGQLSDFFGDTFDRHHQLICDGCIPTRTHHRVELPGFAVFDVELYQSSRRQSHARQPERLPGGDSGNVPGDAALPGARPGGRCPRYGRSDPG